MPYFVIPLQGSAIKNITVQAPSIYDALLEAFNKIPFSIGTVADDEDELEAMIEDVIQVDTPLDVPYPFFSSQALEQVSAWCAPPAPKASPKKRSTK